MFLVIACRKRMASRDNPSFRGHAGGEVGAPVILGVVRPPLGGVGVHAGEVGDHDGREAGDCFAADVSSGATKNSMIRSSLRHGLARQPWCGAHLLTDLKTAVTGHAEEPQFGRSRMRAAADLRSP
jgi:hypothetical protein